MAVRNIAVTDTLETFRTEFNALALNDMGDIATLSGAISATNLVGAMNETISIATSSAGFTIEDSSSTQQIVGGGDILRVFGTSNEIEAVVSATDTLTIGLPASVTVTTKLVALIAPDKSAISPKSLRAKSLNVVLNVSSVSVTAMFLTAIDYLFFLTFYFSLLGL